MARPYGSSSSCRGRQRLAVRPEGVPASGLQTFDRAVVDAVRGGRQLNALPGAACVLEVNVHGGVSGGEHRHIHRAGDRRHARCRSADPQREGPRKLWRTDTQLGGNALGVTCQTVQLLAGALPRYFVQGDATAIEALSDSMAESIGMETIWSQFSRTSRERPLPSEPTTRHTGSVASDRSGSETSPSPSSPSHRCLGRLGPVRRSDRRGGQAGAAQGPDQGQGRRPQRHRDGDRAGHERQAELLDHRHPGDHGAVVAPALLLLMTSFTKIFVVLGLTRNALGLGSTPPTQVLAGLALFLEHLRDGAGAGPGEHRRASSPTSRATRRSRRRSTTA